VTIDDAPEFTKLLDLLGETFRTEVSEIRRLAYFDALSDIPLADVAVAVRALLRTAKFFPKPVEIREAVYGDLGRVIESEWLALHQAMATIGAYRSLICDNPVLGQTILAMFGSWPQACRTDLSDEMWAATRKEFDRVYRVYAADYQRLSADDQQPTVLKGLAQINNEHKPDWSRYTQFGALTGRTARVLTETEAQGRLGTARLLEPARASDEGERELNPDEARAALKAALDRVVTEKGM
jgi:hypothetical protein